MDACVFDPPYFDYIAYDELSEFHRAWMDDAALAGAPLLPELASETAQSFGLKLANCLKAMLRQLCPGRLIVFTYHSAKASAWSAIGIALDEANLSITGLWPVRSDGHMGHHSHEGNCEWDIVIVCRRSAETRPTPLGATVDLWLGQLSPLEVMKADRLNMSLAIEMATSRFASVCGD